MSAKERIWAEQADGKNGYEQWAYVKMKLKQQKKLRPLSPKIQDMFREVRVHGRTQVSVAAQFRCSRQYVAKAVQKMEAWLEATVGRGAAGDWLRRKGVAEHVHRERLQIYLSKSMDGLDRSFQDVVNRKFTMVEGKAVYGPGEVKQQAGNWRWLDLALKAEKMRIEFEYGSGALEPPPEDEVTDAENKEMLRKHYSTDVYVGSPPTGKEVEDARTINTRLEEQRKLLEEERRLLTREREEVAKLKQELEGVLAEMKARPEQGSVTSSGHSSTAGQASSGTQDGRVVDRAADGTRRVPATLKKEKPRPQFTWRYATVEDFCESVRRRRAKQRIDDALRRGVGMVMFSDGPPLEVKRNVYIVAEPYPIGDKEKAYREEWLRQEAEAKAAGKPWREAREKFKSDGYRMVLMKE